MLATQPMKAYLSLAVHTHGIQAGSHFRHWQLKELVGEGRAAGKWNSLLEEAWNGDAQKCDLGVQRRKEK
eukprot:1161949-Pelagomonas_calceolata.AAC.6